MIKVDRVFWGTIGSVMLIMIIPFSLFGFYLYWVPHIPEHISKEIGFFDTVNVGLINLILYVLVAFKLIRPKSKTIKMYLMSIIPIAFLNIYLIEYKHFLIYYKQYAYKIVFLKEGKEIRPLLPKRPEEIFKGYIGEPVLFKKEKYWEKYDYFHDDRYKEKSCYIEFLYLYYGQGIYLCKYQGEWVFLEDMLTDVFPSGSFLFKIKNSEEFIKNLKRYNN